VEWEWTYRSSSTTKAHNGGSSSTEANLFVRPVAVGDVAVVECGDFGSKTASESLLDASPALVPVAPVAVDHSLSLLMLSYWVTANASAAY